MFQAETILVRKSINYCSNVRHRSHVIEIAKKLAINRGISKRLAITESAIFGDYFDDFSDKS
jgi:hypothetical protein